MWGAVLLGQQLVRFVVTKNRLRLAVKLQHPPDAASGFSQVDQCTREMRYLGNRGSCRGAVTTPEEICKYVQSALSPNRTVSDKIQPLGPNLFQTASDNKDVPTDNCRVGSGFLIEPINIFYRALIEDAKHENQRKLDSDKAELEEEEF